MLDPTPLSICLSSGCSTLDHLATNYVIRIVLLKPSHYQALFTNVVEKLKKDTMTNKLNFLKCWIVSLPFITNK